MSGGLNPNELQALVPPIALYPDPLVAQILTASTYPDQVAAANTWYKENAPAAGGNLMAVVDAQSWDPSIKALTQFPSVLNNMASNLPWASSRRPPALFPVLTAYAETGLW